MRLAAAVLRLFWRAAAVLALLLGAVGLILPALPTVPFLLLAAWCGGRGWPAVEVWLLKHPRYGETIRRWRERRAIPRKAKWAATGMMLLSSSIIVSSALDNWLRFGLPVLLLCVALWLWRCPDH